jgi:hypothetical protein
LVIGLFHSDNCEGLSKDSCDGIRLLRTFIFDGLNGFDQSELESMGVADYFHPDVHWYGPGGIGACLSFEEFEHNHQRHWLKAFPDRSVQDLDALDFWKLENDRCK